MVRYSGYIGFKPCYTQTSPVFLLLGNLLSSILIYWVHKSDCIGLVPYFCLHSARHRQVIAAVFVSISFLFGPARSFCLACEEAPLLRAGLSQLCEAACFRLCIISQPAGLLTCAGLSFARRPVAALCGSAPRRHYYYIRLILVCTSLALLLTLLCFIDIVIGTIELLRLPFCSEVLG